MIEMHVAAIIMDARTGHPIVVLNDDSKRRALPIWIGMFEASAISKALENQKPERPMTHDLLLNAIEKLSYKVKQIEINELASSTYFATIILELNAPGLEESAVKHIDARPSDAIALALRAKAPIFVSQKVIVEGGISTGIEKDDEEAEEFKRFVDNLKASDFALNPDLKSDPDQIEGSEQNKE